MSYWCGGYRKQPSEIILLMHKIACHFAKQHYGECHMLTDEEGAKVFKNLNFSSIEVIKNSKKLPEEYNGEPWSFGKMVAYQHLASQNVHFLHFDYDVFMWKKLPSFIEEAEVFAQNKEANVESYYGVPIFNSLCKNKHFLANYYKGNASNCGIFGGTNSEFILNYSSSSIEMIINPANKKAWLDVYPYKWCRAVIAEQFYLNAAAEHYNVPITHLFNNEPPTEEDCKKYGYTHLWGAKDNPYWQEKIKQIAEKLNLKN